jgi:hypothetical protein
MAINKRNGVLFKPIQCTNAKLSATELTDGYVYFCTDTKQLYADLTVNGTLQRFLIANDYELPTATSTDLGGVAVGDTISIDKNGKIYLNEKNITDALGFTPIKTQNVAKLSSSVNNKKATVSLTDGDSTTSVDFASDDLINIESNGTNGIKISTKASPSNEAPQSAGTASAGTKTTYSRSDHVHPEQTDITGNAATSDGVLIEEVPVTETDDIYDVLLDNQLNHDGRRSLQKSGSHNFRFFFDETGAGLIVGSDVGLEDETNTQGYIMFANGTGNGDMSVIIPSGEFSYTTMPAGFGTLTFDKDAVGSLSIDSSDKTKINIKAVNGTNLGSITTQDTVYSTATSTALGLVKIGYIQSGKNYPVQLSNDKMYVNVPWIDDTATTSANGLMSSTDKTKLDNIAEGANKYILPTASSSTLGGIKTTSDVTSTSGYEATPIIDGVPYYKTYTSLKSPYSLTLTTTNTAGTKTTTAYDGSAAKSLTINPTNIGAAAASHTHSAADLTSGILNIDRIKDSSITNEKIQSIDADKITGVIDSSHIPGSYDEIKEYSTSKDFPAEGEEDKIYVDKQTNLVYRWGGQGYIEISASLALGTTSKTAFAGDLGQIAYEHSQEIPAADAVKNLTSLGLYKIQLNTQGHVISGSGVEKSDITKLGVPSQNTTYTVENSGGLTLTETYADKELVSGVLSHSNKVTAGVISSSIFNSEGKIIAPNENTLTSNAVLGYSQKFVVPNIQYDNTGHIVNAGNTTFTLPAEIHNIAKIYAGKKETGANGSTSNGGTYITVADGLNDQDRNMTSINIKGSDLTAVVSDSAGNITINSSLPDTLLLTTFSKSIAVQNSWAATGIQGENLDTGTYAIRVTNVLSDSTSEAWSGILSWYKGNCSEDSSEEIVLHNAGAQDSGRDIYLRTTRVSGGKMKLEIAGNYTTSSTININFSFRRLI